MPPRDWRVRLQDIVEAAEKIERYTVGLDREAFVGNEMIADAVTRNIAIIGEAARYVPDDVQQQYPDVPWRLMWGMRNVLVHDYPGVDLEVVWRTLIDDLPPTIARVREILEHERASGQSNSS